MEVRLPPLMAQASHQGEQASLATLSLPGAELSRAPAAGLPTWGASARCQGEGA